MTPEIYKAISSTSYSGEILKDESAILMMNNITRDLGYTSIGDKKSNRKTFLTKILPNLVEEIQNTNFDDITGDSDDLQGEGVKIIIPSNIIDIYARLEILLGLKLFDHTDTLTEASNLIDELYKRGKIQTEQQYRIALDKFLPNKMEIPSKLLDQIAFDTRSKIEEHLLIGMNKSTHAKHLSQPLQASNKQFKIAMTFLFGYNGIFNVTDKTNKFYFTKSISDEDGFIQILIPKRAYELESTNNEIKRIIIEEEHYTEANYPLTINKIFQLLDLL